jgi:uncharacterized protein YbjT (DUF2867 family)
MSKYLVAGATGRVGSVVARELLAQKHDVHVLVRNLERGAGWAQRGAQVLTGTLEDSDTLAHALEGAAGFFTLLPEDPTAQEFHAPRRRITESIARAVARSRVPHVVLHSATGASLAEGNGPARGLHELEQALAATGTTLTANRAVYLQENIASALAPARHAGIYPNLLASADLAFPTIATADIGRFAAQALRSPPRASEVVDLLGPSYSARQMSEVLGAALGRKLQVVDVPPQAQVPALMDAGLPREFAEAVAELFDAFSTGRIVPRGDRSLMGTTTLDVTLQGLLAPETQSRLA